MTTGTYGVPECFAERLDCIRMAGALSIAEHEFAGQQLEPFVLLDEAEGDESVVLDPAPAACARRAASSP